MSCVCWHVGCVFCALPGHPPWPAAGGQRRQLQGWQHLAFSRARTDGAPRDEVGEVLRGYCVKELAAAREAELVDVQEDLAGDADALLDVVRPVEVWVVDQPLPWAKPFGLCQWACMCTYRNGHL